MDNMTVKEAFVELRELFYEPDLTRYDYMRAEELFTVIKSYIFKGVN